MPRNTEKIAKRDQYVKERFRYHRKQNPRWQIEFIIEKVADEVFLSTVMVVKILKKADESVPTAPTMSKYNKAQVLSAAQTFLF